MTAEQFERIHGSKPPAKLQFFLRGDDLYHRDGEDWILYDPPVEQDCNPDEKLPLP